MVPAFLVDQCKQYFSQRLNEVLSHRVDSGLLSSIEGVFDNALSLLIQALEDGNVSFNIDEALEDLKPKPEDLLGGLNSTKQEQEDLVLKSKLRTRRVQRKRVCKRNQYKRRKRSSKIAANDDTLEDDPSALENDPVALEDNPSALENDPVALEDNPSALENDPVALEDNPSALENDPVALEDDSNALEDDPVALEDNHSVLEDDSSALEDPVALDDDPYVQDVSSEAESEGDVPAQVYRKSKYTYTYTCETCGKIFTQKYGYRRHIAKEHEGGLEDHPEFGKIVSCDVCNQVFPFHQIHAHKKTHRKYPCEICGKNLSSPQALRKHKAIIHHDDKTQRIQCEFCGKGIRSFDMKVHMTQYHPESPLKCSICSKEYAMKSSLQNHYEVVHGNGGRFVCARCGKAFLSKAHLQGHERTHTSQKPHVCETCGKGFSEALTLKMHVAREHAGGYDKDPELSRPVTCEFCGKSMPFHRIHHHKKIHKKYPCDICGIELSSPQSVRKHQVLIHKQGKTDIVECQVCGKTVHSFKLNAHMSQYHPAASDLICRLCSKEFKNTLSLRNHVKYTHGDDGEHVCTTCGKRMRSASDLRGHEISHSDARNHVCGTCGKAFKYKAQLSRHTKLDHEGKTPFKCTDCGKVYRTKQRLRDHVNQHLGIKPCVCGQCGEAFATSSSLDSHRKKHRIRSTQKERHRMRTVSNSDEDTADLDSIKA
ncbi:unnamed protein product [Cyprideis torosa]|uniref:Uncharacterized protein n=1 Tax=Cyprideis torosa TaxID=163714 RepID=A0A7R8ZLT9_9CRUS|nr:unnamed protein product [Cyprideis torosa]CAG0887430.1 unnamed protein product [Cyprideis torosa]